MRNSYLQIHNAYVSRAAGLAPLTEGVGLRSLVEKLIRSVFPARIREAAL